MAKRAKVFKEQGFKADIKVKADHAFAKTLALIQENRTTELAYDPHLKKKYTKRFNNFLRPGTKETLKKLSH